MHDIHVSQSIVQKLTYIRKGTQIQSLIIQFTRNKSRRTYCPLRNKHGVQNGFQRFLGPVYYQKSLKKLKPTIKCYANKSSRKPLKKLKPTIKYFESDSASDASHTHTHT